MKSVSFHNAETTLLYWRLLKSKLVTKELLDMAINVGINGFGRIGRLVFRAILQYYPEEMNIVAFNDLGNLQTMAHLLKHDSVHGRFNGEVVVDSGTLVVNGHRVKALSERDPAKLPWGELGVDIVIESTGIFRKRADAAKHIDGVQRKFDFCPCKR
jgi:glyceraldehyde 3-phosphate dehydrogenase